MSNTHARNTLTHIKELAVVPIIRTPDRTSALAAVEAVLAGGLDCVEITMTVANAVKAIEAVADQYGDRVLLGAGTVLDPETARACMLAGAQFFVTPSLNLRTIEIAHRYSKPIFPGALTPTEIQTAWECGADGIKVFPCNALGGPKYIKAVKAPFPQIELIPTGGVNLETLPAFLAAGCAAVGVGSELVDNASVTAGNYQVITERSRQFREAVLVFRAQQHPELAASLA
jgi:2-dehydro-3-deoxyphosphogluconate aldolase / (4S)-4-hydroxy-2-oxoglutarate aldolase